MKVKDLSIKEMAKVLSPLLKRNFAEWKRLTKDLHSKCKIKYIEGEEEEKRIEKILFSDPVAAFYAYWFKLPKTRENDRRLEEKITGYILGFLCDGPKDEWTIKMLFIKCNLIANLHRDSTLKMIDSALALQELMPCKKIGLQEILENEKAYKVMLKSSMSSMEWRFSAALLLGWAINPERNKKAFSKIIRAMRLVLAKREEELFS